MASPLRSPIFRALRPHQWAKNALLVVPLITSRQLGDPAKLASAFEAFVSFSLMASAVYVVNDLVDREADRAHPTKRLRPFASGELSARFGAVLASVLLLASLGLAGAALPGSFVGMLLIYVAVTSLYSFWLKRKMLVDVICLAGLYTLRILAGGAAEGIVISPWLLAFSMFLFLSLAFAKRYAEIAMSGPGVSLSGRGYIDTDLDLIRSVGPAAGCLSVLVLCLYLNSPEVSLLYRHPRRLWFLCPIQLYWILRIWFVAHRNALRDDPVLFALRDRASWLAGLLSAGVIVAANWKL